MILPRKAPFRTWGIPREKKEKHQPHIPPRVALPVHQQDSRGCTCDSSARFMVIGGGVCGCKNG